MSDKVYYVKMCKSLFKGSDKECCLRVAAENPLGSEYPDM